jgi:hypothetical protein
MQHDLGISLLCLRLDVARDVLDVYAGKGAARDAGEADEQ